VRGRSINVESGLCEGLAYVRPELPHFGVAVVDALQGRAASDVVVDLHVRREGFERADVVAAVPSFNRGDDQADVLLRHRPVSIAAAGAAVDQTGSSNVGDVRRGWAS
jgi:hypothetical protein